MTNQSADADDPKNLSKGRTVTTRQSAALAETQLSKIEEKPTSPAWPNSPTSAADRSLRRHLLRKSPVPLSDYISLQRLAEELEVDLDRLKPLISHRYLRIMRVHDDMAQTVVARPSKEAMAWLRTMFMPLDLRPLIPLSEVLDVLGLTDDELRYICVTDNIPIYDDPVFGELFSVTGFWTLSKGVVAMRHPLRSDRQMLLMVLAQMKNVKDLGRLTPLSYSERLEGEIKRIMQLPEPDKTLRATDFFAAYSDADTITDMLERGEMTHKGKQIAQRMESMRKRMERQGGKKATAPESADDAVSGASERDR